MRSSLSILLIVVLTAGASCEYNDIQKICNVEDPVNDLEWLRMKVVDIQRSSEARFFYLVQGEHDQKPIFFFGNCCPNCLTLMRYYDCEGTEITEMDYTAITNTRVIWKAENFACTV